MYCLHNARLVGVPRGKLVPGSLVQGILRLENSPLKYSVIWGNKPTCLMAPPCSLSSPGLLHRIGFSCSVSYLPPMYLQLKEIKWLCKYFCFLFLGCFYSFYFIISMCSLFLSMSFSVLYLTFFSCSFFVPKALHTPTYWVVGSQAKGRGCRNYLRVNPVSHKSVCKL